MKRFVILAVALVACMMAALAVETNRLFFDAGYTMNSPYRVAVGYTVCIGLNATPRHDREVVIAWADGTETRIDRRGKAWIAGVDE